MGNAVNHITLQVEIATDDHSTTEIAGDLGNILIDEPEVLSVKWNQSGDWKALADELRSLAEEAIGPDVRKTKLNKIADALDGGQG